jgi:sugar (pentulose or hexulose) kinase
MASGWTIVLDVGKTLSKATLWDEAGHCIAQRSRPNQRPSSGTSLTLDAGGIERWLVGVLTEYAKLGPVSAIVPVAHGAGVALIRRGQLQCAPLDYEWSGVSIDRANYNRQRDPFFLTGSPALPAGLNLGIQLHWLEALKSGDYRSGHIVPWAQYWAWVLSGVEAAEITSLGCHSDLWLPYEGEFSELASRRGWAERLAPLTPAGTVLGTLEPEWVKSTGLSPNVRIYCGLHDTNAALLDARNHPALKNRDATVLSTGTWFVAMRLAPNANKSLVQTLPESRDCLVNVDAAGAPVPSSRFMGGREIELLAGKNAPESMTATTENLRRSAVVKSIESGAMILPSGVPGVGPFPKSVRPPSITPKTDDITGSAHLYAAMLADVSLELIGSCDTLLVEGRFSASPIFVQALAALRPTMRVLVSHDENGVARGALRLAEIDVPKPAELQQAVPLPVDMGEYRRRWRTAAELGA